MKLKAFSFPSLARSMPQRADSVYKTMQRLYAQIRKAVNENDISQSPVYEGEFIFYDNLHVTT